MKRNSYFHILFFSVLLTVSIGLLSSCSEEQVSAKETHLNTPVSIDTTFNAGEAFIYDLGSVPFEGGYSIRVQASQFAVSEIQYLDNATSQYVYQPRAGYQGKDAVVLFNCVSTGAAGCVDSALYRFNFVIK